MNLLVTGAAGFIGSHVAGALLRRGDRVTGVDNFNDYYDVAIKYENAADLSQHDAFTLVSADIRETDRMRQLLEKGNFDRIIHLAAMAGVRNSIENPRLYFDVNYHATKRLIDIASEAGVAGFVHASTSSAYGDTDIIPFMESDPCQRPPQPYAASKRAAEIVGQAYHQRCGLNFTSLRFFSVYGPSGRPDMMPSLLADSIFHGREVKIFAGDFQRDWTFVEDIVDGILAATDHPLGFEIINMGRGEPQSLQQFINVMETVTGGSVNGRTAVAPLTEMPITYANIDKAQRLLGFEPKTSIDQGIAAFWSWYLDRQLRIEKSASLCSDASSLTFDEPHIGMAPVRRRGPESLNPEQPIGTGVSEASHSVASSG